MRGAPSDAASSPTASGDSPVTLGNLSPIAAPPEPDVAPLEVASASPPPPSRRAPNGPKGAAPLPVAAHTAAASTKPAPATAATAATTAAAVASVAAPAPADFNPASAYVVLGQLSPSGVREDAMRRKMGELLPKLSECYRNALMVAGSPIGGSAAIHMSIDEKGTIMPIVNAPKLPQFSRCAQLVLSGQRVAASAVEGGSSGATASQWLTLHP